MIWMISTGVLFLFSCLCINAIAKALKRNDELLEENKKYGQALELVTGMPLHQLMTELNK